MLCMQQCIDLCEFTPEEAQLLRQYATLAEIMAIQTECPCIKAADKGGDAGDTPACELLDIRERLSEELWAADDFDDLESVLHHYCDYEDGLDTGFGDAR